jgi:1,4-dihydroxy-2-naphthoate octaprenyltransferase
MVRCYLLSGFVAMALMFPVWMNLSLYSLAVPLLFLLLHVKTWKKIKSSRGAALNPLLGATAKNLLLFTLMLFVCSLISFFA